MGCVASFSRQEWFLLVSLCAVTFTTSLCASLQAPFYPGEAEKKGATATEYGFVFGVFELTAFITCPLYGKYMGIFGVSFVLKCGILVAGVSTILFGLLDLVDEHWTFISVSFILRIIESLGTSAVVTSSLSLVVLVFSESFARVFAILEVLNGLGYMVGPTVGGYLFEVGGFKCPFMVVGVVVLLCGLFIFFALPNIEDSNGKLKHKVPISSVLKIVPVSLAALCMTIEAMSVGFITATLEPHLRDFHLTPTALGAIFVISGAVYTCTAPLVAMLCDRQLNTKVMIVFGSCCVIAGYMLIGPLPFTPFNTTLLGVGFGQVLDGVGMSFIFVPAFVDAIVSSVQYGLPDDITTFAMVSGIYASSFALGAFIGPSVSGILFDYFGFRKSTLFVMAVHVLMVVMMGVFLCAEGWYQKKRGVFPASPSVDLGYDPPYPEDDSECQALVLHVRASSYASTDNLIKIHGNSNIREHNRGHLHADTP